ncbi:MAG: tetratricopeptide repeat protein [Deltaproteobacteria bacterium]|nr:tetratricopeptide repeat protein [Deltaproteobacteria bacterium]
MAYSRDALSPLLPPYHLPAFTMTNDFQKVSLRSLFETMVLTTVVALFSDALFGSTEAQPQPDPFSRAVEAAQRYSSAGLTLRALELLESFHQGDTANQALAESSRIRFAAQDFAGAAKGYRELLQRLPSNSAVERNLLMALYRNFEDAEAVQLISTMGKKVDQDLRALTVRGLLAARRQDHRAAEADLSAAVDLDDQDPEAPYELGRFYLSRGQAPKAVSALEDAVSRDPAYAQAHYNLGLALTRAGDTEKGQKALATARALTNQANEIRIRYIRAIALSNRAQKALTEGRTAAAVKDLEEALSLHPEEPNLQLLLERAQRVVRTGGS